MSESTAARIVLTLEGRALHHSAWHTIVRLATHRGARIEGVFVEDAQLIAIAASPMSRFVHTLGASHTELDPPTMRRIMRATSARARLALDDALAKTTLSWTFRSQACAGLTEAFIGASAGDLVVVPLREKGANLHQIRALVTAVAHRLSASLLILNERGRADRSILVLFDGDEQDLHAAVGLAESFHCPMQVMVLAADAREGDVLAEQALDIVGRGPVDPPVDRVTDSDPQALIALIARHEPGTLAIDRATAAARWPMVDAVMRRLDCSVYLRN
jgi:hypothetical protein